jgi:hypothetical protein
MALARLQLLPITLHVDELDWGLPFIVFGILASALYVGVGIAYGKKQGGPTSGHTGAGLWKAHPHAQHFENFAGEILDMPSFRLFLISWPTDF